MNGATQIEDAPLSKTLIKQILAATSLYGIAVIAQRVCSVLLLPLYTRFLTPTDYGIMELVELSTAVVALLVGLRVGDALFYFYARAEKDDDKASVVSTIFLSSWGLAAVIGLLGWIIAPWISAAMLGDAGKPLYFRLLFFAVGISLPAEVLLCYLRATNAARSYLIASIVKLVVSIGLTVSLVVGCHLGVAGVFWSNCLAGIIMTIGMTLWLGGRLRFQFDRSLFRGVLAYAGPICISSLGMFVVHFGDRFILRRYVSLADIGIYSLAYKLAMMISYVQMPFSQYWYSQMFHIAGGEDGPKRFARVGTYLMLTLTGLAVCIAVFAHPILRILAAPEFESAANYLPVLLAAYVIRGLAEHLRSAFFLHKATMTDAQVVTIGVVACVAGYVFLIPKFQVWGAVSATLAGFSVMFVASFVKCLKLQKHPIEVRRMISIGAAAIITVVLFGLVHKEALWQQISIATLAIPVFVMLLFAAGFLDANEHRVLKNGAPPWLRHIVFSVER